MTSINNKFQNIGNQSSNQSKYDKEYLEDIEKIAFSRMDEAGNGDGKITVDEAFKDLDIGSLLSGQNLSDIAQIAYQAKDIEKVLEEYAGDNGEFSAEEWADFLNGEEWGGVLDAWHSSGKKAELEMSWIDKAGIEDGKTTKGEVKVGLIQNLDANGIDIDTTDLEALVDKYAGKDGTFSKSEYKKLMNDPIYKAYREIYNITPWFRQEGN